MITDEMRLSAEERMQSNLRTGPKAVRARHDRWHARIVIRLDLLLPTRLVQGLAHATDTDLAEIEISQTGLGLHWPRLDADVHVPGLLDGVFGSRAWMASLPDRKGDARRGSKTA